MDILSPLMVPYDANDQGVRFVELRKGDLGIHPFHMHQLIDNCERSVHHIPLDQVPTIPFRPTIHIMHLCYGGSTLISSILNLPNKILSFNEHFCHRVGGLGYEQVSRLFSRQLEHECVTLIKTLPYENSFIREYAERHESNVVILLHQSLTMFIINCFGSSRMDIRDEAVFLSRHLKTHIERPIIESDAIEHIIHYWTTMMSKYKEAIGVDNVYGLRSEDLFDDPIGCCVRIANMMDVDLCDQMHNMQSSINIHSKYKDEFSNADRINQYNEAKQKAIPYLESFNDIIMEREVEYTIPDHYLITP